MELELTTVVQCSLWLAYGVAAVRLGRLDWPFVIAGPLIFVAICIEHLDQRTLPTWAGWGLGILIVLLASVEF